MVGLSQTLSQKQTLQQRQNLQLQMAQKLLQLTRQELELQVKAELEQNPCLDETSDMEVETDWREEIAADGGPVDRLDQGAMTAGADGAAQVAPSTAATGTLEPGTALDPLHSFAEAQAKGSLDSPAEMSPEKSRLDEIDWAAYVDDMSYGNPAATGTFGAAATDEELPGYDQTLTRSATLEEHLLSQVGSCSDFDPRARRIALQLVNNIEDDGFIHDLEVLTLIAEEEGTTVDHVEHVRRMLMTLDPIGIAARDMRESLLVQAAIKGLSSRARDIVDRYLDDIGHRDISGVARKLKCSVDEVREAVLEIRTLDPHPGRQFLGPEIQYVTPDVYVVREGDGYRILLNDDGMPKLRLNSYYREALRSGGSKEAKAFVREKMASAKTLIQNIDYRKRTIYRVMESILKHQRGFFDIGVEALKPLVLRDVAEDLELDESTISRATNGKYVETPRGLYPLKFFFRAGVETESGEDMANEAVKVHIKRLIDAEDPRKPLSDEKLCQLLAGEQIKVARRTVAKYREQLGILNSADRRKVI